MPVKNSKLPVANRKNMPVIKTIARGKSANQKVSRAKKSFTGEKKNTGLINSLKNSYQFFWNGFFLGYFLSFLGHNFAFFSREGLFFSRAQFCCFFSRAQFIFSGSFSRFFLGQFENFSGRILKIFSGYFFFFSGKKKNTAHS